MPAASSITYTATGKLSSAATGLYFAGDYNLRGRTPEADVDVCFTP
jgi:hypothetical protein